MEVNDSEETPAATGCDTNQLDPSPIIAAEAEPEPMETDLETQTESIACQQSEEPSEVQPNDSQNPQEDNVTENEITPITEPKALEEESNEPMLATEKTPDLEETPTNEGGNETEIDNPTPEGEPDQNGSHSDYDQEDNPTTPDDTLNIKHESVMSENEDEDVKEDIKPKFLVEELKKIAFFVYLKTSLPDCEIVFREIKKIRLIKEGENDGN